MAVKLSAGLVSLGIATLVLASVLTFTLLMPSMNDKLLEANYQKSFYDVAKQVDNIRTNATPDAHRRGA